VKKLSWPILLLIILSSANHAEQPNRQPLTVTFVGNEGFLIENGDNKILIDALFGGFEADWCQVPSDSIVNLMTAAQPPFDHIDLIALTHAHVDHFTAEIAAAHLLHNPDGIMICPPQAAEQMAAIEGFEKIKDRLRTIPAPGDSAVTFNIAGIEVTVLPTRHNVSMRTDTVTGETFNRFADVQHLEYLIDIGGWNLYHGGDSPQNDFETSRRFGLGEKSIDIAFLQWWGEWSDMSRRQRLAHEVLRPDRVIFMHLRPGREIPDQPDDQKPVAREIIAAQRPMKTWTFK